MDVSSLYSTNGNGNGHDHPLITPTIASDLTKPICESSSLPGETEETPSSTGATPDNTPQTLNEDETTEGRDAQGRFTKGNKGGPGNPYNRRVAEYKRQFQEALTPEIMGEIIAHLIEMARNKDKAAIRMVLQYNLDKRVQPDKENLEEWGIIKEEAKIITEVPPVLTKPEPELPLRMVRESRSLATGHVGHMMCNLLSTPQEQVPELMSLLKHDPKGARQWLDNGAPKRKETRRERKAKKAQQRKRPG